MRVRHSRANRNGRMLAIDTNVLVRLIVADDHSQYLTAQLAVARGAWVQTLVLAEAVSALSSAYEFGPAELILALEMLLQHAQILLEDSDAVRNALAQFRIKPALGFSDCLILELARKRGHLPLATFDRDLARCPGAVAL